ncbi:MAG: hypothetical protein FJY11_06330 [Bacteroidetes bacterium]|nr:hypothetical protein [Bacteroidota bacterium]
MNEGEGHRNGKWTRRYPPGVDRDIFVFVFFLALSFSFWYLNGLSKVIENTIRYPVRYINPPRDRVLASDMPPRLEMELRGPGYSILKLRLSGSRAPVIIDMSKIDFRVLRNRKLPDLQYILTADLNESFRHQLRADFSIVTIKPDTLFFRFDRLITKKVPVIAEVEVVTGPEFFVKGTPEAVPDSVYITGPAPAVDTVNFIKTRVKRFTGVSESFSSSVQIAGSRDFSISERRARVAINIERFTEARMELPVKIVNKPDSIDIKLFPDEVTVRALVAVSDYQGFFDSNIQVVVDLSVLRTVNTDKLPVSVVNVPAYARSVVFSPQELDYIIEPVRR